jgi:hypothetical protein
MRVAFNEDRLKKSLAEAIIDRGSAHPRVFAGFKDGQPIATYFGFEHGSFLTGD